MDENTRTVLANRWGQALGVPKCQHLFPFLSNEKEVGLSNAQRIGIEFDVMLKTGDSITRLKHIKYWSKRQEKGVDERDA